MKNKYKIAIAHIRETYLLLLPHIIIAKNVAIDKLDTLERKYMKGNKAYLIIACLAFLAIIYFLLFGDARTQAKEPFTWNEGATNLTSSVEWNGGQKLVKAYIPQINEAVRRGYTKTQILDLFAIKAQECNRWDGMCEGINNADMGPFQINWVHKEAFAKTLQLMNDGDAKNLFLYQLTFAYNKIKGDEEAYCNEDAFNYVGKTFNNENRFKCVSSTYNGGVNKLVYAEITTKKRAVIKQWLADNSNFLIY